MRKFFSELGKFFGKLLVCALEPLFSRLHGILLLSLATAQESAEERSKHKRKHDERKWVLTARSPRFRRFIKIGKIWGRFRIGSKVRRRV